MTSVPEFPPGERKTCDSCGAIIPFEAVKCTKCESFQGVRRYLQFSPTILALLTALVSVIATGAPTVSQLFQGYNSKLLVQFQGDDRSGGVVILASNVGNQPGVIKEARLIMPTKGAATPAQVALIDSDSSFILPGKQARLRLVFDIRKQYTGSDFSGKCILLVTAMEFLGKHKVIEFPVSCDELSVVVGAQQST